MKIIEGLKKVKANRVKIADLNAKITQNSARLSSQTSPYGDQKAATEQVTAWVDTVRSLIRDNEILINRIHRTNSTTKVSVTLGETAVTKTIDEWITRRKEGVAFENQAMRGLSDRGLKEDLMKNPDGTTTHITVIRHFDPRKRDERMSILGEEVSLIDSALEIANATTDLVE